MRIDTLKLKGLTRFQDPIALDFRDIPAGLIAVCGENGAGKTTILEAMFAAHYGEMPTRSDRPLFDLVSGTRDAFIEVESTFDLCRYRARQNLDGLRRVRDAVLEQIDTDGRRIGDPLNDGKSSTFDKAVAARWPKAETVLASAFAAQNKRGGFSSLDRKGKKDLFAQLLGLEQLERYATTARAAAAVLEKRRTELQAQVDLLRPMTTQVEEDALGDEGNRLQVQLTTLEHASRDAAARIAELETAVNTQRVATARALAAEAEHRAHGARREDRVAARQQLTKDRGWLDIRYATDLQAIKDRHHRATAAAEALIGALPTDAQLDAQLHAALARIDEQATVKRADLEERIRNNRGLLDRQTFITAEVRALDRLEADLAALGVTASEQQHLTLEQRQLVQEARRTVDLARHWTVDLQKATAAAALIDQVPFGDKCAEAKCGFVQAAVDARTSIPECAAGVQHLQAALASLAATEQSLREAEAQEAETQEQLRRVRSRIDPAIRVEASRLEEAQTRLDERTRDLETAEIEAAEARKAARDAYEDRVRNNATQIEHHRAAIVEAGVVAKQEREATMEAYEAEVHALSARDTALAAEIEDLDRRIQESGDVVTSTMRDTAELARLETALGMARAALANHQRDFAGLEATIRHFEHRRTEFRTRQDERIRLEAAVTTLDTELIEWQALARVFGRDGLPVLEIDAAGPQVSALANDLLQACFSGRFTVELVTQEAKAGGKGLKEAFEIKVWDAERGGEARDLTDLSGGEQVICDEALKSAIALFINGRNTMPVRTFWRDESAGALDPENAQRYLLMLRRIHARGGVHHLFLITHNPEIAAQADAQIVVADGSARIVFPPFTGQTEAA